MRHVLGGRSQAEAGLWTALIHSCLLRLVSSNIPPRTLLDLNFSTSFPFCGDRSSPTNPLKKKTIFFFFVVKAFNVGKQISSYIIASGIFKGHCATVLMELECPFYT